MALTPFGVDLARDAERELASLGSRPRGMLTVKLGAVAAQRPGPGLFAVGVAGNVAACESLASRELVLVYAVRSVDGIERSLFGPELHRLFRRLEIRRVVHR